MKHIVILLWFIYFNHYSLKADEYRTVQFQSQNGRFTVMKPGDSIQVVLKTCGLNYPTQKSLRIIGGVQMPGKWNERGEGNFTDWEYYIDDYLDSVNVKNDKYALLFRGNNNDFARKAYHRISGKLLKRGKTELSVWVKRTNFQVQENGKFGIEVELFLKKEGRNENDIYDTPDIKLWMPVPPAGDNYYSEIKETFDLPDNLAAAVVVVGGNNFSGDCLIEAPTIKQNGNPLTSVPFVPNNQRSSDFNYWTGINLVSRNWPIWELSIDNKVVFNEAVFDRASNVADFYIPLPQNTTHGSKLSLKLVNEAGVACYPYAIKGIELIEQPAGATEIISVPGFIRSGSEFGVLVETQQPGTRISCESTSGIEPVDKTNLLTSEGLHVIKFKALKPGTGEKIIVTANGEKMEIKIGQVLIKNDDHVCLSAGDDIYIDIAEPAYSHYFKWFIHNNIGNFYQFRPSYQWSGLRKPDSLLLKKYLNLLNELDMPYAWQVEGRTLAGEHLNPSCRFLSSPMFKGKQAHENDGGYYYWPHFVYKGQFSDMAARTRPYGGIFAKCRPIYTDHGTFIHYDPCAVKNMEHGANYFVSNLKYSKGESTRHTGPSTLFRYFYQAGYEWLGAELMYGPEETTLSSLRGASKAYCKTEYGSLHAMQWGSKPYTDPEHAHRFYLSLATAYMHGSSHINTEEALWIDEYADDRFSESGKMHIAAQKKMLDFIQTHERRGQQVVDIALVQGRNCPWKCFIRSSLWSQKGDKWKFNKAAESFDLINVFYPQNIIDACGPSGWYTSTPYGAVDLLPVEAGINVLEGYKTIIFMGWNTYNAEDWERLTDFVNNGGTLIFTAAHLNAGLQPDVQPCFPKDDEPVRKLLGKEYQSLKESTTISFGKGKVIYFPQPVYPAEETIREAYIRTMKNEGERTSKEQQGKGWIFPDNKTSFTVWDDGHRRTIYLLNIDWSSQKNCSKAQFYLGNAIYEIKPRSYFLETIQIKGNLGVMPVSNTTDILEIKENKNGWIVQCQTASAETVRLFRGDKQKEQTVSIAEPGIHNIEVNFKDR